MARQNLLLVDSDLRSVRMLEVALRKAGYNVSMARHAAEALSLVEIDPPDLILSDTKLPPPDGAELPPDTPRDGYELCRRLKSNERWQSIPFIFLASSSELEDKIRGLELGVEDYLTKPIYLKELLTRVQLVLARRRREGMTASRSTASRASFSGELADMGIVDLLTTIDMGRKTGVLEVHEPGAEGWVTFQDGRLLDAQTGGHRGERAIYRLLLWTEGRFEIRFGARALASRGEARTIEAPTQAILLEGLRRVDEWHHLEEQLPPLEGTFEVASDVVPLRATSIPPEAAGLLDLVDGSRSLLEVVDASGHDDLSSLNLLSRLYFEGIIRPRGLGLGAAAPGARRSSDPGVSLLPSAQGSSVVVTGQAAVATRVEHTDPFAALEALEVRDIPTPELVPEPAASEAPRAIPEPAITSPVDPAPGGAEAAVPNTHEVARQSPDPGTVTAAQRDPEPTPPDATHRNQVTATGGRDEIVTHTDPDGGPRAKPQERYVSKNKGKKAKGRPRDTLPSSSAAPRGPAAGAAVKQVGAGATSSVTPAPRTDPSAAPEKNLRVEGNVIHLRSATATSDVATTSTAPDEVEGTSDSEAPDATTSEVPSAIASDVPSSLASEEASAVTTSEAVRDAVSSLRADSEEAARTTTPPEEKVEAKADAPAADTVPDPLPPARAEPEIKPVTVAKAEAPAAAEKPAETKAEAPRADAKDEGKDAKKAKGKGETEGRSKIDIVVPKKDDLQRNRKESLSTHLSDEARAFFSEAAYQAAYKHDTFEDLQPAEEHAHESAASKRMMTIIGGTLFAMLALIGGFALYQTYYGVHETVVPPPQSTTNPQPLSPEHNPAAPEAQQQVQAPPTPPTQPETNAVTPTADADAGSSASPVAPVAPVAPAAVTDDAGASTAPVAPTPAPTATPDTGATTAPSTTAATQPAPTGQTPAQLLAAARAYRGGYTGMIAAWNAYFAAAPNDWQAMNGLAERIAEAHPADAESLASRAVAANPTNARGWFILAYTRKVLGNGAAAREARTRCMALGGQWAAECRALE